MTRATGSGLSLLIDNRGLRTLWLTRTTSYLGDVITATAVVLYLYEIGATPTELGLALAAKALPPRGQVFGAIYGPVFLAETAAYLISGPLLEATSPAGVFLIAGTGLLGVAAVAWWLLRRAEGPPPSPRPRPPRRIDSPAGAGTAQSGGPSAPPPPTPPETAIPARSPEQSPTPIR